jgi:hypothetical protein
VWIVAPQEAKAGVGAARLRERVALGRRDLQPEIYRLAFHLQ